MQDQELLRLCCHIDGHVHPGLVRSAVSKSRMPSLPVVVDLDVLEYRSSGFPACSEPVSMDHFSLQRTEEALHGSVI